LLAKRGHCKQKRTDLKIVGLSLMVAPELNIPLFHEVYPGNTHDAQQFSSVIGKLKDRYKKLGRGECSVTLVFDKGNNNEDNIQELIELKPRPFHFVGGLRLNQCQELLDVAKAEFTPLDGDFNKATAYRSKKNIYDRQLTVLVTYNPELKKAQMDGVLANIASCQKALSDLSERLRLRKEGVITKGRKPTINTKEKNVTNILSAEHMRDIFDYTVSAEPEQTPELTFSLNEERWRILQERSLGKSILFTDNDHWTNEQIVSAYRSQYHVEEAFKQMKDTKYLSFPPVRQAGRPIRHFTDNHIRVHAFYCVLALMLTALMNKELKLMGHKMSIRSMLDTFQDAQQVVVLFPGSNNKFIAKTSYSRFKGIVKKYVDKYDLFHYLF
jgi:transposase